MDTSLRLPLELIMIIVDLAVRDALPGHTSVLATLCLVCRAIRDIAEPVLYRVVILDEKTPTIDPTYTTFSERTKALVVRDKLKLDWSHIFAFRNIDVLACTFDHLEDIRYFSEGRVQFRPRTLVITRPIGYPADISDEIQETFDGSVTHLALPFSIDGVQPDCSALDLNETITHVHLSLFPAPAGSVSQYDEHIRQVDSFLAIPTLRRLVCRMVNGAESDSSELRTGLVTCARTHRDLRLAYDGAYQWDGLPEDLFLQDVLDASDSLWESGVALYEKRN
ncbi:hypothetical protein EXIGLDRAFT_760811 [Exidia glandulosa HHB12029]|uniref:F-box domain-containing protein n=1 Tax=Exidia glandulosa HHB12029 TaxID=1314781 RepID=A0A166BI80_EXIGL|nr:hypothetical protein EXIGLDRAFT_760811 [Exidia glandulosa HHB12029]